VTRIHNFRKDSGLREKEKKNVGDLEGGGGVWANLDELF